MTDQFLVQQHFSAPTSFEARMAILTKLESLAHIRKLTDHATIQFLITAQVQIGCTEKSSISYATQMHNIFIRQGWVLVGTEEFAVALHAVTTKELLSADRIGKIAIARIDRAIALMHGSRH
ncbi:hypothetical protein KBD71_00675 [Candidatus Woesebacteria bacterium]|nr:hypothetical protein [Candidatus Woesebacteria bacterium]